MTCQLRDIHHARCWQVYLACGIPSLSVSVHLSWPSKFFTFKGTKFYYLLGLQKTSLSLWKRDKASQLCRVRWGFTVTGRRISPSGQWEPGSQVSSFSFSREVSLCCAVFKGLSSWRREKEQRKPSFGKSKVLFSRRSVRMWSWGINAQCSVSYRPVILRMFSWHACLVVLSRERHAHSWISVHMLNLDPGHINSSNRSKLTNWLFQVTRPVFVMNIRTKGNSLKW